MQIRKSRLITIIILVVMLCVLLSACGKIDFTYQQNRDGTYTKEIAITIDDESGLTEIGYTLSEAIEALEIGFIRYGYAIDKSDKTIVATKTYDSITELRNSEFSNGIYVEAGNYTDEENAFIGSRTINGEFYMSDEYLQSNSFAIATILMQGGITSYTKAQQIANAILNTKRTYTYKTPYKSTTSNADSVTQDDNGYYVHKWNDASTSEPTITTEEIKGAMWYGIAIIIAVCVLLIVVIIKIIKDKKAK